MWRRELKEKPGLHFAEPTRDDTRTDPSGFFACYPLVIARMDRLSRGIHGKGLHSIQGRNHQH